MRQLIRRAIHQADDLVIEFDYLDSHGVSTHRVVSPIRFLGNERFLALCLSREDVRQFYLSRCQNVRLEPAANFLMPVPMTSSPTAAAVWTGDRTPSTPLASRYV